jgi:hypothetical protein
VVVRSLFVGYVQVDIASRDDFGQILVNIVTHSHTCTQAITNPSPDSEEEAWNSVLPAVDQLKEFYDFSLELGMYPCACACDPSPSLSLSLSACLSVKY